MRKKSDKEYDDGQKLDFLNEHVVRDIRRDLSGYVRLVLLIALLISVTALVVYLCLNSEIRNLSKKINEQSVVIYPAPENRESEQQLRGEKEISPVEENQNPNVTRQEEPDEREPKLTPEQMYDSVVVVKYDVSDDSDNIKRKSKAGIILSNDEDVIILLYNTDLKKDMVADVYLWGTCEEGQVINVYEDYKISVIKVSKEAIAEYEPEDMMPAVITTNSEYHEAEHITLIGNPEEEVNIVEKGRLTLKENAVSILDARLRLADTDINGYDDESAFIFNERGSLLGIAGVDEFSGKVYMIDILGFKTYIDKILSGDRIPYIGIYGKEVTDEVIENIDKDIPYGIYISNLKDNSPAYKYGIMNGDIVVSVAGRPVLNFDEYQEVLANCRAGQEIRVNVMRKGKDGYKKISYEVVVGAIG